MIATFLATITIMGGTTLPENNIAPIQPKERINEIDIIRGLALFGILMVNMSFFKIPVFFER